MWTVITDPDEMRVWYFEAIPDFEARPGFTVRFDVETPARSFTHVWTVCDVEPEKKIAYDWSYAGYPGHSVVTFELEDADSGTAVRVRHAVTESFPQDIPEFRRDACREGWVFFIENRLKAYLDDEELDGG